MSKDIILTFMVCVFWVGLVNLNTIGGIVLKNNSNGNEKWAFFDFSGDTANSNKNTIIDSTKKQESPTNTDHPQTFARKFTWIDPANESRETVFHISEVELKKEIKKFGVPHSISHPFFLKKRGFKVVGKSNYLEDHSFNERITSIIDYEAIFRRNLSYFGELTSSLMASADMAPDRDPLYQFLAFVQHIRYQLPPRYYEGKFINSFFIPLVCLYEQYGDCDSKSLLLAEFLCTAPASQEKTALVLVRGRGLSHALLAVKRKPLPGMTSLHDFKKGYFIVMETTKPGWAPGFINARLTDALKAGFFSFVELN